MRQELDEKLCAKFPNLFRDRNGDIRESCMPFGFDHGDGWYDIIHEASEKLEKLIVKHMKKYPDDEYPPRAVQVKEKFGMLRFYMSCHTPAMNRIIAKAERKSAFTCEYCGAPGRLRGGYWVYTCCVKCEKEIAEKRGRKPELHQWEVFGHEIAYIRLLKIQSFIHRAKHQITWSLYYHWYYKLFRLKKWLKYDAFKKWRKPAESATA